MRSSVLNCHGGSLAFPGAITISVDEEKPSFDFVSPSFGLTNARVDRSRSMNSRVIAIGGNASFATVSHIKEFDDGNGLVKPEKGGGGVLHLGPGVDHALKLQMRPFDFDFDQVEKDSDCTL